MLCGVDLTVAIRTALVLSAALIAPAIVLPPPLGTGPAPGKWKPAETRYLSQLAVAGKRVFEGHCADCHGYQALGSPRGPSLQDRVYWRDLLDKRTFHSAITDGVRAYRWTYGDMPPVEGLSFNQIETVARYIHELQQPHIYQ